MNNEGLEIDWRKPKYMSGIRETVGYKSVIKRDEHIFEEKDIRIEG